MSTADVTILCLPDTAAKEAVTIAKSLNCRVIDASSAHRTSKEWIYGLPEISKHHRENIKKAKLVANPGCFATAAILLPRPLILINKISRNDQLSINAVSGYSGGGSGMISKYEPPLNFHEPHLRLNFRAQALTRNNAAFRIVYPTYFHTQRRKFLSRNVGIDPSIFEKRLDADCIRGCRAEY